MQSPNLQDFVERLMTEKGYRTLSAEAEASLKQELLQLVNDKINATIVGHIPESKQEEFGNLIDGADDAQLQEFIIAQVPNLQEIVSSTLLEFRRAFLA